MEKIGAILNKIVKRPKKEELNLAAIFSSSEQKQISRYFIKNHTLFVYVKSSAQAFDFSLKEKDFLKKAKEKNLLLNKIIFRLHNG